MKMKSVGVPARVQEDKAFLRSKGLKVTRARLRMLEILSTVRHPLSVQDIRDRFGRHKANQATVYRCTQAFLGAGILRRIDLRHGHVAFEIIDEAHHHHHLVCTHCGKMTDVEECIPESALKHILKKAPDFAEITEHAFELYGTCHACKQKNRP